MALVFAMACAACTPAQTDQHGETHGYLILRSASVEQGWKAVDAIQAAIKPSERRRVRTAAPIGEGPGMFIDFTGSCASVVEFVRSARAIAAENNVSDLVCTDTPPRSF